MNRSLHRKQKKFYVTSGRNSKDLDLLDASSEKEIKSLPLEIEQNVLSVQGLASRSPQLDSSSREEMYYPRDPIQSDDAPHEQCLRGIHMYGSM